MNESGTGFLRVRVTEAGGSLPVQGAVVQIFEYPDETTSENGDVIYSLRTNENGLAPIVSLPAPAAGESMTPGAARPYSVYNISVTYDGYYPVEGIGIPIFDRITAIQPIDMVPLTEEDRIAGADNGRVMIYETPEGMSPQPGGVQREEIGDQNGTVSGGVMTPRNNAGGRGNPSPDSQNSRDIGEAGQSPTQMDMQDIQNARPYDQNGRQADQNSGQTGLRGESSNLPNPPSCYYDEEERERGRGQ